MMTSKMNIGWKAVLVAGLCAISQTSCGGSSGNAAPAPAPSPGVASPSPSPSSSTTLSWVEVSEISQCPSHPLDCPTANGFNVDSSGAFSVDSQGSAGNVDSGDLSRLNAIASQYAANSGLLGFSCSATMSMPGSPGDTTVSITYSDGSSQTIFSIDTASQQTCMLGSLANAQAIFQLMSNLAGKYNPTPAPSPSPSSSATMTLAY